MSDMMLHINNRLNYHLNTSFKGRKTSDDPNNLSDVGYGNGNALTAAFISSGAIEKNKVFYRFSTQYKNFDGLLTNEFLNKKVDFRKELTLRGQLKFKFSPQFKASTTTTLLHCWKCMCTRSLAV